MSVDGTWNITMSTPMGDRPATVRLQSDGGALSGAMVGQQGEQAFSGGTAEGNNVAWSSTVSGPMGQMELKFAGAVDGDSITGTVQFGSFGSGSFKGTRA
jgi:hypothetical protein